MSRLREEESAHSRERGPRVHLGPSVASLAVFSLLLGCGGNENDFSDGDADSDSDSDPEPCGEQGATRTIDCGFCGELHQICAADRYWRDEGPCENPGECQPGALEDEACGECGLRERLCASSCEWQGWGECVEQPDPECTRGEVQVDSEGCEPGEVSGWTCSEECRWEHTQECSADCPGDARGVGTDSEEICIPGGPFIMGGADETSPDDDPEHEAVLLPYFIGRYEVSHVRYGECMDAGACTLPEDDLAARTFDERERARYPVWGLTWDQAVDFCTWDGGRLPTEAEWEKAARGAAPDRRRFPWGGDAPSCEQAFHEGCPPPEEGFIIDGNPASASPFGVERLAGGSREWTKDFYDAGYYAESPRVDPQGPAAGDMHAFRSVLGAALPAEQYPPLTARDGLGLDEPGPGVRCVRRVEER